MKVDEKFGGFMQEGAPIPVKPSNNNVSLISSESASSPHNGLLGSSATVIQRDQVRGVAIRNLVMLGEVKLSGSHNQAKRKKSSMHHLLHAMDTSGQFAYVNEANKMNKDARDVLMEEFGSAGVADMSLKTQDSYNYWKGYWDLEKEFVAHPRWADRGAMRQVEPYLHEFAANLSGVKPWQSILKLADIYLSSHENTKTEKVKLLKNLFNELSNLNPEAESAVKKLLIKHRKESENCYWRLLDSTSKEVELPKQLEWLAASKLKRVYILSREFLKPKKPIYL